MEDEEAIKVRAELPGLTEKDVEVTCADGRLTIRGEKKMEKEWTEDEEERQYRRFESSYGSFFRSFALPEEVEPDQIKATVKDGVMEVVIPKGEKAEATKIEVQAG
jgi:HSP20 family protein